MADYLPDIANRSGPRYVAIADAIAEDIAKGRLPAGSRLPTHRDLAFRLKVTVGTITRAYSEAERRGLVAGEVGRGTFVLGLTRPPRNEPRHDMWPEDQRQQSINMAVCQPHASGVAEALAAALIQLAESAALDGMLDYPPQGGVPAHRRISARWLEQGGVLARPETTLLTSGAQAGIATAFAALTRPGDAVATECLTYFGMKAVAASLGLKLEGLAIDDHGLVPAAFDAACRQGVRALYTVPTLHNPTATVQPLERREEIIAIARRHNAVIVEDDVFGFLVPGTPTLQSLAPDLVVHLNSLSKSVAAGLRVGFVVAPERLVSRIEHQVRAFYYGVPLLQTEIAARWMADGTAEGFAQAQRTEACQRMALAKQTLAPFGIDDAPACSLHLWLKLPEPWRREEFVSAARRRGVAVAGAESFAVGRVNAPHAVRIGLCMPADHAELQRGLTILSDILHAPATLELAMV